MKLNTSKTYHSQLRSALLPSSVARKRHKDSKYFFLCCFNYMSIVSKKNTTKEKTIDLDPFSDEACIRSLIESLKHLNNPNGWRPISELATNGKSFSVISNNGYVNTVKIPKELKSDDNKIIDYMQTVMNSKRKKLV